jgi:hypothetical protein
MAGKSEFDAELTALKTVLAALEHLDEGQRNFVLQTATSRLGARLMLGEGGRLPTSSGAGGGAVLATQVDGSTPKAFLTGKRPSTDVERIACLAYYLTHHRNTAHFKTKDISALNTEAAQPKLSNAAFAVKNATQQSKYLAPAGKGQKQITALGEAVVAALPDRDAVKAALTAHPKGRRKRGAKKGSSKKSK